MTTDVLLTEPPRHRASTTWAVVDEAWAHVEAAADIDEFLTDADTAPLRELLVFTALRVGVVNSAVDVAVKASPLSVAETRVALERLCELGYVTRCEGGFELSDTGREMWLILGLYQPRSSVIDIAARVGSLTLTEVAAHLDELTRFRWLDATGEGFRATYTLAEPTSRT